MTYLAVAVISAILVYFLVRVHDRIANLQREVSAARGRVDSNIATANILFAEYTTALSKLALEHSPYLDSIPTTIFRPSYDMQADEVYSGWKRTKEYISDVIELMPPPTPELEHKLRLLEITCMDVDAAFSSLYERIAQYNAFSYGPLGYPKYVLPYVREE